MADPQLTAGSSRTRTTGRVLMLACDDDEALRLHARDGRGVVLEPLARELWHKGATSGNTMAVDEIRDDCDGDALLYRVRPNGPGVPHGRGVVLRAVALARRRRARRDAAGGLLRHAPARRGPGRRRPEGRRGGRRGRARRRRARATSGWSRSSPTSGSTATSSSPRAACTPPRSRTSCAGAIRRVIHPPTTIVAPSPSRPVSTPTSSANGESDCARSFATGSRLATSSSTRATSST